MMNDSIDPRFDPAFQPGFTPKGDAGKTAKAARSERPASPAQAVLAQVRLEAEQPVVEGDVSESARRPNPFLIALMLLSLALIVAGFGAVQLIRHSYTATDISSELDYVTYQILTFGAPLAIGVGILIGAGVLFVYAVRWPKRY